jgi:hypothetical protein
MLSLIRAREGVCALLLALEPTGAGMVASALAEAGSLQWSVMTDAFGTRVDYPAGLFTDPLLRKTIYLSYVTITALPVRRHATPLGSIFVIPDGSGARASSRRPGK